MADLSDWAEKRKKRDDERKKVREENLPRLWEALAKKGVKTVTLNYDGSGDSGEYYMPVYEMADGTSEGEADVGNYRSMQDKKEMAESGEYDTVVLKLFRRAWNEETEQWEPTHVVEPVLLDDALEHFLEGLVGSLHSGWENNEGGRGEVEFDVENRKINYTHEDYYIETHSYEYVYDEIGQAIEIPEEDEADGASPAPL